MIAPDSEQTQCGSGPSSGSIERLCSTGSGQSRQTRPAAGLVEECVLDVLGDQPVDERLALLPLRQPPAPLGHAVLDHGDGMGVDESLSGEVSQHESSSVQQRVYRRHGFHPGTLIK